MLKALSREFLRIACLWSIWAGLLGAANIVPQRAIAQEAVVDFYKGKQIKILVGAGPGGGYDLYSRGLAERLGAYIPGNPTIIVQNQPAAGSIVAANTVYTTLPQDGTVIAAFQPGALFDQILGSTTTRFETTKFHWLGSMNQEAAVAITYKPSKVQTFDDLMKHESIFGMSGPNTTEQYTSLLRHLFGAKIKQIAGYESVTKIYPGVERGELEGLTTLWGSIKASVPHWVRDKHINVLVQFSFDRQPDLPDTPMISDYFTPARLQPGYSVEETRAMMRFIVAPQAIAWPFAFGPGVPADRVDMMRAALKATTQDREFLAMMQKLKREVNFLDGVTVQKMFEEAANTPKETLAKIGSITKP